MPVYFIRSGDDGPVKIGVSWNPAARIKSLAEASPVALRIIRVVDGNHQIERQLHARYKSLRLRGEWFLFCPTMMGDIGLADLPIPSLSRKPRKPPQSSEKQLAADFAAYLDNGSPLMAARLANWIAGAVTETHPHRPLLAAP
jgi:hypothetical protein